MPIVMANVGNSTDDNSTEPNCTENENCTVEHYYFNIDEFLPMVV